MAEKTIQGKPCPKCFSFVSAGSRKCGVCGFELEGKAKKTIPENGIPYQKEIEYPSKIKNENVIICSKCGTENHQDFRFCKICKHPLLDDREASIKIDEIKEKDVENKKGFNILLRLDWIKKPAGYNNENTLSLKNFITFLGGYLRWKEYVFITFKISNQNGILVRKIQKSGLSSFYKRCSQPTIVDSGKEFYLGTIKFQLLGDLKEREDVKTVMKSDKTIIKEPGESRENLLSKGKPRLKILNMKTSVQYIDIDEKFILGRNEIANFFKTNEEKLRKNGISKKHITIMPIKGGKWLIEPLEENPFYEEINEIPMILTDGDIIRWVPNDQFGEFKVKVEIKEN